MAAATAATVARPARPAPPPQPGDPPVITPPLRPPLGAELKSDVVKVLNSAGFCVFNREVFNVQCAEAAFSYLHVQGLGIYLKNVVMYTVNKNASLWSSAFLTKVAGTTGHIFIRLPHGYLSDVTMSARLVVVQAQIPQLSTTIADPRAPIKHGCRLQHPQQDGILRTVATDGLLAPPTSAPRARLRA